MEKQYLAIITDNAGDLGDYLSVLSRYMKKGFKYYRRLKHYHDIFPDDAYVFTNYPLHTNTAINVINACYFGRNIKNLNYKTLFRSSFLVTEMEKIK